MLAFLFVVPYLPRDIKELLDPIFFCVLFLFMASLMAYGSIFAMLVIYTIRGKLRGEPSFSAWQCFFTLGFLAIYVWGFYTFVEFGGWIRLAAITGAVLPPAIWGVGSVVGQWMACHHDQRKKQ